MLIGLLCLAAMTEMAIAAAAGSKMTMIRSRFYDISTDVDPELAKQISEHMDLVFAEYSRRFSQFRPRSAGKNPLSVFRHHADYMKFLAGHGIDATGSGGMFFYKGQASGLVTFLEGQTVDRMFHTLRHEGFHQFAFARIGPDLPVWANEGLAEYFSESIVLKRTLAAGQVPVDRVAVMRQALSGGKHIPLGDLLTMSDDAWANRVRRGDGSLQYDQAWSVVHFLVNGDKKYQRAFEAYLKLIAAGTPARDASDKIFGTDVEAFEQAWRGYVQKLEPTPESTAAARLEFLGQGLASLHAKGQTIATIDDLRTKMQAIGFRMRQSVGHGVTIEMSAAQDKNFQPPEIAGGKAATMEMEPSKDGKAPPQIIVRGLKAPVRLAWQADDAGDWQPRIVWE
jgi:hypothetical protein